MEEQVEAYHLDATEILAKNGFESAAGLVTLAALEFIAFSFKGEPVPWPLWRMPWRWRTRRDRSHLVRSRRPFFEQSNKVLVPDKKDVLV
jgi:hypothetical protein